MPAQVAIDSALIQARLDELHRIGARPSGTFRGVYDSAWRQAQALIERWMVDAGLQVWGDPIGNLWGLLPGSEPGPPIVAGSHFDTVPNGGKYDGQLGHVGALTAIEALGRQLGQPRRSLAVLATCEEEGSRFHCNFWAARGITGEIALDEPERIRDFDGVLLADAMRAIGLDPTRVADAATDQIAAFVELHIEQGPVLERLAHVDPNAPRPIGVVSAITGTGRLHVTITGRPDHSGTTPMIGRKDAFLGAAEIALALREMALGVGHPAVMTVGRIELSPNIPNVVAGEARFTVDVRHPDPHVHRSMLAAATSRCYEAAHARGLGCEVEEMWCQPPAHMAPDLVERVRAAAVGRGYRAVDIVSGAGHDSQIIARRFPTAMLFVVTAHGRSHCPDEHASPEDCAAGVEVLADVLASLAY